MAYRFLEDGLISPIAETKSKAISLYNRYPEIRAAAAQTFQKESLQKTIEDFGLTSGSVIERNRLRMYAVVANDDEIKVAADNLQSLLDQIADTKAKEGLQAAAQKSKEEAEAKAKNEADALAAAAKMEKEKSDAIALDLEFERSKGKAFFKCKDRTECEKAFSLTQIFIATNTDMKIQMANDTIIETFNPSEIASMGATAFKIPKEGASAEIRLIVTCKTKEFKEAERVCKTRTIKINSDFPRFLRDRLMN